MEEEIISKNVKLIIVDSVASVIRKEFDTKRQGNLKERSNLLSKEASILKYLAEEFSIPVSLFSLFFICEKVLYFQWFRMSENLLEIL